MHYAARSIAGLEAWHAQYFNIGLSLSDLVDNLNTHFSTVEVWYSQSHTNHRILSRLTQLAFCVPFIQACIKFQGNRTVDNVWRARVEHYARTRGIAGKETAHYDWTDLAEIVALEGGIDVPHIMLRCLEFNSDKVNDDDDEL